MSSHRERVADKQNTLDAYVRIYQTCVNDLNNAEETSDIYRQALLENVENVHKAIFKLYKEALDIKAAIDFNLPVNSSSSESSSLPSIIRDRDRRGDIRM